jgi:hypothetical protein
MEECLKPSVAQRIDDHHNHLYHKEVDTPFKQMRWFVKYLSRRVERVPQTDVDRRIIPGNSYGVDQVWKIDIVVPIHSKWVVHKLRNILDNYEEIKSRVAELEYELDRAEEGDDDELPPEVRRQRSERLAKMNAELNVLSEALAEYELNR